ncbi:MAG: peptidoglycan DD-metalloendopeptidase family protein [Candidatus Krumholzibacteriota bacterium]|nr:peptidoglycan DD-metalloendopeptidase family protein [Candidatus Krumholzibacteriota bacterium]
MDRYFTFLYVRRGNAGVRSFRIHRRVAAGLAVAVVILLGTAIVTIGRLAGEAGDARRVAALEEENARLRSRLAGLRAEVSDLENRMAANFTLQNRARLLANLDPISDDVWQVGVGGPEPAGPVDLSGSDLFGADIAEDLDKMIRQSELELASYEEIVDLLQKEAEMRDATPSIRPLRGGYLSSRFGRRMDPFSGRITRHLGVDYHARTGEPVISTADGIVTMAKKNGSFGLEVEINHGNGFKTRYGHLSKMLVKRGQRVKRGETIGLVGNTGRSTGPHLHYEVLFRKVHRDPLQYVIPEGVYFD